MVITDGNLSYAILNAIRGPWFEVNKKSTYNFGTKDGNMEQPLVSIDSASPVDCKIFCDGGICYLEINKVKYKIWYKDTDREIRLELHSSKTKLRLAKI